MLKTLLELAEKNDQEVELTVAANGKSTAVEL